MLIKITKKTAGVRLDKFLSGAGSVWAENQPSRGQIQKLIKEELALINGRPAVSHYLLRPGDIIDLRKKLIKNRPTTKETPASAAKERIEIVDQTAEFLVINKPAGLAVHGAAGYTLADWLKKEFPEIKTVGDDPERPGLVHRLDKNVSGLMVIAKTPAAFEALKKQFQDRTIIKEYTALVHGQIQKPAATINFPIQRSREGYKMAALPLTVKGRTEERGRTALTEFRVAARLINYTRLKIKIKTGRTHQIRVHLAAYGHPLVGDNTYGSAKTKRQNKKLGLDRIFLVADHLNFHDLSGQPRDYKTGLTEKLENLLKTVK